MLGARNAKGAKLATRMAIFLTMGVALVLRFVFVHYSRMMSNHTIQCDLLDIPKSLGIYV